MSLAQNIKDRRKTLKLSQGYVADQLGVSRQAVSKWESGQSEPSADNLAQLAELFEISLAELVGAQKGEEDDKLILHANLTNLAIAMQVGALHACANAMVAMETSPDPIRLWVNLGSLFFCSLWMARNLFYEKDPTQRRKNSRIELCYCVVQLAIALLTVRFHLGLVGFLPAVAVLFFYLYYINPRYMNRAFTQKGIAALREKQKKNGSL